MHQPLAFDDPLAVVAELAATEQRLEHRRSGLLDLEEERVSVVAPEQQEDPAARADAAHADDLAREIDVAELFQQSLAIGLQRSAVTAVELQNSWP